MQLRQTQTRACPQAPWYYDSRHQEFEVPRSPWSIGEDPEEGRTHLDFFVHGEAYPDLVIDATDVQAWYDGLITLTERGSHPLVDPANKRAYPIIEGQNVNNHCDGHSAFTSYRLAHAPNQREVVNALEGLCVQVCIAINKAKSRKMRKVKRKDVHYGTVGVGCRQGRHRSTWIALEGAKYGRELGCTCRVHFMHLYVGPV